MKDKIKYEETYDFLKPVLESYKSGNITFIDFCNLFHKYIKKAYDFGYNDASKKFLNEWFNSNDPVAKIASVANQIILQIKKESEHKGYMDGILEDSGTFCFGGED